MVAASVCSKLILRCRRPSVSIQEFGIHSSVWHHRVDSCISSSSVIFPLLWQLFPVLAGNFKALVTQASSNEEEEIDKVLNQIVATKSNGETCTVYVDRLCRAGNLSMAVKLLESLREKGIFFPNAYTILLAAAGERKDTDLSSKIFKDLLVSCGPLRSASYRSFARAFAKTVDCAPLIKFVKEVSELGIPGSTAIINRIIFAFANSGQAEKALLMFNQIESFNCNPDLVTYNTVLEILGHAGRVDQMLSAFASMKEAGIVPNLISYNTLLNNLRKVGRLDMCLVFFKEMLDSGIEPDLFTYTALIESFGRSGDIDKALKLFSEMKQRQIRPSIYVYRSLINNLKKVGKIELAVTLLKEMNSSLSDLADPNDFRRKARYN